MKLKFKYSAFLFVFVFNFILFYEPFLYAANLIRNAGALNPIVAPIIVLLILVYVIKKDLGTSIYYLSSLVIIAVSITLINRGVTIELFRDLTYLCIVLLLVGVNTQMIKKSDNLFAQRIEDFIKYFLVLQFVIPIIFFPILFEDNRLPLNNLSDTNSALVLCFFVFSYLTMGFKKVRIIWLVGFVFIVLSGSRAAFLFYVLGGIFFKDKLISDLRNQKHLVIIVTVVIVTVVVAIVSRVGINNFRVISLKDVNEGEGSVYSRLNWYLKMYKILSHHWFAGFGGGYAEYAVGKIVHNDVLRFWIDYSILYPIVFYGFFFIKMFELSPARQISSFTKNNFKQIFLIGISLVIMALYNGFQDLNLVLSFVTFFSIICYSIHGRMFYKRLLIYQ